MQDQLETVQVVENALQISVSSLSTEYLDPVSVTVTAMPSQQVTAAHWLPSMANSHTPVKLGDTLPQQSRVSAYEMHFKN